MLKKISYSFFLDFFLLQYRDMAGNLNRMLPLKDF